VNGAFTLGVPVKEMGPMPVLVTIWEPPLAVVFTATSPQPPLVMVALGAWPVPVKPTLAIPPPLCVKLNVPVRVPAAAGVKLTLTVQVPFTATEPQLLDCAKSVAPAEMPTPVNVRVLVPVLVTVTV
jgi:hypothetical protein